MTIHAHDAGRSGSAYRLNPARPQHSNGYRHEWTPESFEATQPPITPTLTCNTCDFLFDAKIGPYCPLCRRLIVLVCDVCRKPVMAHEAFTFPAVLKPVCCGCATKAVQPKEFVPKALTPTPRSVAPALAV